MFNKIASFLFASMLLISSLFCNQIHLLPENEGTELKSQLLSFLEDVDLIFKNRVENQIIELHVGTDEAVVLFDVMQLIAHRPSALRDILKGAHVRLQDNGYLFSKWEVLPEARKRISSHLSVVGVDQYGIAGPITHEILFGIVEVDGELMTFFQLENTPWSAGWRNRLGHVWDAIMYKLKNLNVGPYGNSYYLDSSPLII
jgi:hypothetical protein